MRERTRSRRSVWALQSVELDEQLGSCQVVVSESRDAVMKERKGKLMTVEPWEKMPKERRRR